MAVLGYWPHHHLPASPHPRGAPRQNRADTHLHETSAIARHGDLPATAAALSAMLSTPAAPAPNDVTLLTVISACAGSPTSPLARPLALSLHALAIKLFRGHLLLCTCLARFYLASRLPHLALQLFGSMPFRSVVTYNTMITGLMRNALVDAACQVFDEMPAPDKVSWTALIDGCLKNGRHDEAIECFHAMLLSGVEPDYVTLIAVISACAEVGALGLGMWVHRFLARDGLEHNVRVTNSEPYPPICSSLKNPSAFTRVPLVMRAVSPSFGRSSSITGGVDGGEELLRELWRPAPRRAAADRRH